ncbi:hypothetical protein GCM10027175_00080 [Hymenobacter latericoloratus]
MIFMRRSIFIAVLLCVVFAWCRDTFAHKNRFIDLSSKHCYTVTKLDSSVNQINVYGEENTKERGGVYIIWAQRNDSIYKIVSHRSLSKYHRCIKVGSCYSFQLKSYSNSDILGPAEEGFIINGTLVMADGESMYNLFYDENLRDLCFQKRSEKK